ncbi:MAG: SAM-dependent methyltransferase [Bacteroidales bacterium]|nr:SAM-dependent methyltransferase [Bacteroidales bacterium]
MIEDRPQNNGESGAGTDEVQAALYLFPVPLSDSSRIADVLPEGNARLLRGIRHFLVENVRSARRFMKRVDPSIDVNLMSFTVLDEHTRPEDVARMLEPLENGEPMGVISEAGCPAVADPGADAVAVAQRKGLKVVPLVGPSSILMALMGSGFNGQSFAFNGYLPIEAGKRSAKLREMETRIRREGQTQIFIETPYRNNRLIAELVKSLPGQMRLCVATDITGRGENITTRALSQWGKTEYDYAKVPTIFLLF